MLDEIIMTRGENNEAVFNFEQNIILHSPTGMEFSYYGSGPADTALNILALYTDEKTAERLHQQFKIDFIGPMPQDGGRIKKETILKWIKEHDII